MKRQVSGNNGELLQTGFGLRIVLRLRQRREAQDGRLFLSNTWNRASSGNQVGEEDSRSSSL